MVLDFRFGNWKCLNREWGKGHFSKWKWPFPSNPERISDGKKVQCEQCDFSTNSQRGLKVHIGRAHKLMEPEILREDHEVSLNISNLDAKRDDDAQTRSDAEEEPDEQVKTGVVLTPEQRALFFKCFLCIRTSQILTLRWPEGQFDRECPVELYCCGLVCTVHSCHQNKIYLLTYLLLARRFYIVFISAIRICEKEKTPRSRVYKLYPWKKQNFFWKQ